MVESGDYSESQRIKFSPGWVERYVARNKMVNSKGYGERDSVNKEEANEQLIKMINETDLASFNEDDIFNMDETGLDWRTLHKNGYVVGEAKRIKVSKERITALAGSNFTSSQRFQGSSATALY